MEAGESFDRLRTWVWALEEVRSPKDERAGGDKEMQPDVIGLTPLYWLRNVHAMFFPKG